MSEHKPDRSMIAGPLDKLAWQPMDATHEWWDGAILLVAVPVCAYRRGCHTDQEWYYEYSVVRIACDEHYFSVMLHDGNDWGWELSDVDWYVTIQE